MEAKTRGRSPTPDPNMLGFFSRYQLFSSCASAFFHLSQPSGQGRRDSRAKNKNRKKKPNPYLQNTGGYFFIWIRCSDNTSVDRCWRRGNRTDEPLIFKACFQRDLNINGGGVLASRSLRRSPSRRAASPVSCSLTGGFGCASQNGRRRWVAGADNTRLLAQKKVERMLCG